MAVVKGIENLYGASFTYHKISDVRIISGSKEISLRITVDSYVDKAARIAGKKPVRTVNIISNADFALTAFYALLKAKFGDYADSTDDFEVVEEKSTGNAIFTQQSPQGEFISQWVEGSSTDDDDESTTEDTDEDTTTEDDTTSTEDTTESEVTESEENTETTTEDEA